MSYRVRRLWVLVASSLVPLFGAASTTAPAAAGTALFGFTPEQSGGEHELEQRFDADLNASDLRGWLKTLSSEPNQVGSPHDKANAEAVRDLLSQWGWDRAVETFDVHPHSNSTPWRWWGRRSSWRA